MACKVVFKGDGLSLTFVDYLSAFEAHDTLPPGTWFLVLPDGGRG